MIERLLPHGLPFQTPNRVILHAMAAFVDYEGERIDAITLLDRLGFSAHVVIDLDANPIRCRHDNQIAYHAKHFNENSLGVEVLVPDAYNLAQLKRRTATPWVSTEQMDTLVEVVSTWKRLHKILRMDRHSDVDPERRWFDPGAGFNWTELLQRTWS